MDAKQVPLRELLASVPADARLLIDDADGKGSRSIPVGRLCQEAAAALAEPVQEPEQFDHGIGDDRFKVVRGAYWWHVLIGDGTKKYGKFHTQAGAEEMATLLLREFKNGAFVQHRAALAEPVQEPTAKDSLQVEQAIAETATTQQQVEQTPPSEYRRGYWDGFEIGKREGRIEAEDALAEPVQAPVAWMLTEREKYGNAVVVRKHKPKTYDSSWWTLTPLYTAPPQRKPLSGLEVERLLEQVIGSLPAARRLVRAIERAHGIGDNDD